MKAMLPAAFVLSVALSGLSHAEDKKPVKDALPRASAVEWDVRVFEEAPSFEVIKREVKGNNLTWVLENKRNLGTEITFGYQATYYDADGVKLGTVEIEVEPFLMNMPKGDRNRFVLHLPRTENWKGVRKVVIKNGQFSN